MTILKVAFCCVAAVGLVGCSGATNPETATLFDNINNLNSGEYDRQIASNKAEADAILANNAASERRISGLRNQSAANSSQLASLRSQLASAREAAASARSRVAGDAAKTARLTQLEGQLSTVSAEVNSGAADPGVTSAELRRIRSAIASL